MWEHSSINGNDSWEKRVERLDKKTYNYLRKEIEDVRFYSKCLDGTSYVPVSDLNNIYDVLNYKTYDTYKINKDFSNNFNGIEDGSIQIQPSSLSDTGYQYRYNEEYGYTLKNLFTPKRVIDDSTNYLTVDLTTNEKIDLNNSFLVINGITLKEGHRVLVKDNVTNVTLESNVDPETFFISNYYISNTIGSSVTYYYYNSDNGIYKVNNGYLIRESDLDNYLTNLRYSVHIKLGTTDQYHLSRLLAGIYPLTSNNEPIEFVIKKNYIVRNNLEYRNTLDNQFYGGVQNEDNNIIIDGKNYQIPERFVGVGDFGFIINYQDGYSNILKNKYKENLKDITSLNDKYLTVGDCGTLLSVSKLSMLPEMINLDTFENFNSINFINDQRGIIVGDSGTILLTKDQYTWTDVNNEIRNNLNRVNFIDLTKAIIVGDNGVVNELIINNNNILLNTIDLTITPNIYDSKKVVADLSDVDNLILSQEKFKFIGNDWVDINKTIGGSDFSFDFRFKPTELNGDATIFSFLTKRFPNSNGTIVDKGIKIIIELESGEYRLKMYVNNLDATELLILDGYVIVEEDKWYHVFVSRDHTEYKLYVDNQLSDSTTEGYDGIFDNFNDRIRLGSELTYEESVGVTTYSSSFNHFKGVIDQVRLFDKNLDDNEIEVFSKNYTDNLSGLVSWYKFHVGDKKILTQDIINEEKLISSVNIDTYNILPTNELVDTETFTGIIISGENLISIVLDTPFNYSNSELNTQLFIYTETNNIRNITYNSIDGFFYGTGDNVFRIDSSDIIFDLFNNINVIDITEEILIQEIYQNLSLDITNQKIYLIGGESNQINYINISSICDISISDPTENCDVYVTVSTIGAGNSITIENDYRNYITDNDNISSVEYIKSFGFPNDQSIVNIPIKKSGLFIDRNTELYCSLSVENLVNGYFEISLDGFNFTQLTSNGSYLIPMTVGSSILQIRAILGTNAVGTKVKGKLKDFLFYEADCINDSDSVYDGGTNIKKLYFSQFDTQDQLNKLNNNELYSYIDLKSLKIDGIEKIDLGTYSINYPTYLYPSNMESDGLVTCIGGLCDVYSGITGNVIDRIRYGLGLTVSSSSTYDYINSSYGLLEGLTINGSQQFGIDRGIISNGTIDILNPYFIGIDYTRSFRMEVDSMIIGGDDILNVAGSQSVNIDATTISYGTSSNYFNEIGFTGSTSLTYSIITNKTLYSETEYYIEMELDGDLSLFIGTQSFTYSGNGSIIKDTIRLNETGDYDSFYLESTSITTNIYNLVFTDRFPTKNIIEWDPDICKTSYRMGGVVEEGVSFLQSDGGGEYTPPCVLVNDCNNSEKLEPVITEDYWEKFNSRLLFLDYDIASKLYFFDTNTNEYQLPNSVDISNISSLNISSIYGEKSWIDYSKDITKEFGYLGSKNESNSIKYSSTFTSASSSSTSEVILSGNSTNDISNINGATQGLLPNFDNGTVSLGLGVSTATYSYYFYDSYMIVKMDSSYVVSLGDIIRIDNSLIQENLMTIYILEDNGYKYIYLKTTFNQSITNKLKKWTKTTKLINLNNFLDQSELVNNFNIHPIGVGYNLLDNDDGTLTVQAQFNPKTAYYNLQSSVSVTDVILTSSQSMEYLSKVLSFGYSAKYNILDYLSKNPKFNYNYLIGSMPSYNFSNNNNGVIYTVSEGTISFNSNLKNEWDSFHIHTFIDMIFGSITLESILILDKYYDEASDRYIIQTYNYFNHVYNQNDLNTASWTLRSRNKLGEISSDLQKINNIQKSSSTAYHITDLSNNISTSYTNLKSELNFKPNTDGYSKYLLSQGDIKEHLTGILYTDYKNELAVNMINLPTKNSYTVSGVSKFEIDCPDCIYDEFSLFENPSNNIMFNQYSMLGDTEYYTNRLPESSYGYSNNVLFISGSVSTTKDIDIDYDLVNNNNNRTFEFIVNRLEGATIQIIKNSIVIGGISSQPNEIVRSKFLFVDNGIKDLILRINYTSGDNYVDITNMRVGNEDCTESCFLAKLTINDHNFEIGDGIIVDLNDTIYNLDNQYESQFETDPVSGWEKNVGGTVTPLGLIDNEINMNVTSDTSIYLPFTYSVTAGELYRITFDYKMTYISGTPSLSPAYGTVSTLLTEFETLSINGLYEHVEVNFIPTVSEIYIGFNIIASCDLKLNNISFNKIEDVGEYYDGYRIVNKILNDKEIVINSSYNGDIEELSSTYSYINICGESQIGTTILTDLGNVSKFEFDPYLNYSPIDIFELGKDDKIKQSIEIKPDDWIENSDNSVSISDTIDMENYRFRLVDGLSLVDLNDKYPWVLESEIRQSIIGKDENGIVWYSGIWDCGRWFGSKWYSGTWRSGEWYSGDWYNSVIEDNIINVDITILDSETLQSVWYSGNFHDGTWHGGEWRGGNFYKGVWNKGEFLGGTWHNGLWISGYFRRGLWISGIWEVGIFNCDLGISIWLDGTWLGGDFESGHWFNGRFDSKNGISTFGNKSSLSRPSIWENGQFINGIFNSNDNTRHDLSIWKTGYWNGGTWNGGTAHQINFNNGTWNNGVIKDIEIISFYGNDTGIYFFTLRGDWKYKQGDIIWIIDNNINNPVYGTDDIPSRYKVDQDYISINNGEYTKILVSKIPTDLVTAININGDVYVEGYIDNNIPTDNTIEGNKITSIVSYLSKCDWYNGQFQNGIFDGNFFRDGIWERGSFKFGNFGY